jgi:uncharacterized protein (DUF486 family)
VRRFVRESSLGLAFLTIFLAALVGQAFVGHSDFNHDQVAHQDETMSLWRFVTSSAYWVDVMENWQSEYLQFTLFILGTVWLVQRGSPESKQLDKAGRESDAEQQVGEHAGQDSPKWARVNGWRRTVYENSLGLLMGAILLGTWLAQLFTGRVAYNTEQLDHHEAPLSLWQYAGSSDFWNRTLQNWQSEFLAVASMVLFSIWLRQRGSPESKPVGAPHDATGVEG